MSEILEIGGDEEKNLWRNLRLGYTKYKDYQVFVRLLHKELYPGLDQKIYWCLLALKKGYFVRYTP